MLTLNEIEQVRKHTGNDFATVGTVDATPTVIYTIETLDNTVGIVEYLILAMLSDGTEAITGKNVFRYINDGTTLTVGTEAAVIAQVEEASLTGSSYAAVNSDPDIEIEVTGLAATEIEWKIIVQHWYYTVTPVV
jgi:hypothetical protein